jgi:hypothetical protein
MKYGSSSCSLSLRDSGGKRPKTSGPGASVGDVPAPLSFADVEGTGSHAWAGAGFAGSRGGALRLFFGTEDAGWEWSTSLCLSLELVLGIF